MLTMIDRAQYFRPQTVFVSQLFLQIIAYILGRVMEELVPGPGNPIKALQMSDTWFWRFLNHGPFSMWTLICPYIHFN